MALHLVPAPPLVADSYEASLRDFQGERAPSLRTFHLPVGALGLPELAGGATLADVVPTGCRILASWPDSTWTSCEMTNPTIYATAQLRNFTPGNFTAAAFARIEEAQELDAVKAEDYELRFLSVPGIFLEALHLVCRGKGSDLVLPLVSSDPHLGPDVVCDEATFLAIARASAAARLAVASADPLSS